MSNFPTSLDDAVSLPNPGATDKQNNPSHSDLHTTTNEAVRAVEAKVGISSSTPTSSTILKGTGTGSSAWGTLTSSEVRSLVTDETGTGSLVFATTPTLVTPKADVINEATSAAGVTVDGLLIKDSKLATNDSVVTANITNSAVTTAKINDDAVTAAKIDFGGSGTGVWWEEIGRTTLGSTSTSVDVTGIPARKYLYFIFSSIGSGGTVTAVVNFNNDTGNNYATRVSSNGAADATGGGAAQAAVMSTASNNIMAEGLINNELAREKTSIIHSMNNTNGAANIPDRQERVIKWANTAAQINRVTISTATNQYAVGSSLVILGHD